MGRVYAPSPVTPMSPNSRRGALKTNTLSGYGWWPDSVWVNPSELKPDKRQAVLSGTEGGAIALLGQLSQNIGCVGISLNALKDFINHAITIDDVGHSLGVSAPTDIIGIRDGAIWICNEREG